VTAADLREYFHAAGKPRLDWRVGAEFEKFAVDRATGRPLSYEEPGGIRDILAGLVARFDWEPHHEDGHLTTLTRNGATVSLEPGGQVELSTAPCDHVGAVAAELTAHLDELRAVADPDRVAFLASGVHPTATAIDVPFMPRRRHAIMAEYLPQRSPSALEMMKATASTQAAFDFSDEADASLKFATALALSPVVNAAWGNAPVYAGRPTGLVSYRGRVWRGMDPDRSGLLPGLLAGGVSFARWVDYLLDVPMMFTCIGGRYRPAGGRTFRDFLERGEGGHFPTRHDWEVHLTTVFPEVRMKRFIEVRGADANGPALAACVPALWKGLLYDDDALAGASDLARSIRVEDLPGLFDAAYRQGLSAEYRGRSLCDWCRELAGLSADGLRRQGSDEARYLEPLFAVLERGRSPGAEFTPGTDVVGRFAI
jgi:glutamate--cysteine ligase